MNQTETQYAVSRLVNYGLQKKLITREDAVYAANRMLEKLHLGEYEQVQVNEELPYPAEPLQVLCDWAVQQGITEDNQDMRDMFDTELMDCLMPRPSQVIASFYQLYEVDKKAATDYYYTLSRNSNYIRVDRIQKDQKWATKTPYGEMIITINLSKPEKDPKAIAAAKNAPQSGYPKCALCRENEGFTGSANQAARANHRLIPFSLGGEEWFIQYSPYVYYNEHCILLNAQHKPMQVSRDSIGRLLAFIELFPHYFVGSNADLPIVGGSILSHDHFQGGNFEFPMAKAGLRQTVSFPGYADVKAGIVDWPMSAIRITGENKEQLLELAGKILTGWRGYSDETADIFAFTGETPHNTITPIARRRGAAYELDLVLRNNRTTREHPLGLFHPHQQYHHIKKENIGLIEVMGLAILPPRLLTEIEQVKTVLLHPEREKEILSVPAMAVHTQWVQDLKKQNPTQENALQLIQDSIGTIFMEILSDAGVYKDTPEGNAAILRFCESIGR